MQFPVRVLGDEHKSPPLGVKGFQKRGIIMPTVETLLRRIVGIFMFGQKAGRGSNGDAALLFTARTQSVGRKQITGVRM